MTIKISQSNINMCNVLKFNNINKCTDSIASKIKENKNKNDEKTYENTFQERVDEVLRMNK